MFKEAGQAAGIPNKSAYGIRKAAATRAANNGAMVATLEAIFGWEADRWPRSLRAPPLSKTGTAIPAPDGKVREIVQKGE